MRYAVLILGLLFISFPTPVVSSQRAIVGYQQVCNGGVCSTIPIYAAVSRPQFVRTVYSGPPVFGNAPVVQYPVRGANWSVDGNYNPSREQLIRHLRTEPEHAGKFDASLLDSMTYAQLLSLHSDLHENVSVTHAALAFAPTVTSVSEMATVQVAAPRMTYMRASYAPMAAYQMVGVQAFAATSTVYSTPQGAVTKTRDAFGNVMVCHTGGRHTRKLARHVRRGVRLGVE